MSYHLRAWCWRLTAYLILSQIVLLISGSEVIRCKGQYYYSYVAPGGKHKYRLIPDEASAIELVYGHKDKIRESETENIAPENTADPIPNLVDKSGTPDGILEMELRRITILSDEYVIIPESGIFPFTHIHKGFHPSIAPTKIPDTFLLAFRGQEPMGYEKPRFQFLHLKRAAALPASGGTKAGDHRGIGAVIGLTAGPDDIDHKLMNPHGYNIIGEQVRFITTAPYDVIQCSYTTVPIAGDSAYKNFNSARMKSYELHFNANKNIYEVMTSPVFMQLEYPDKTRAFDTSEKNWIPIISQNQTFYVHTIDPFTVIGESRDENGRVIREASHEPGDTVIMKPVSSFKWSSSWKYGLLRGSTNSVQVGNYLVAIVHSRTPPLNHGGHWVPHVYFNAAILFDATFPFTIRKASKVPIIRNEWYNGPWCCTHNKHLPISYPPYAQGLTMEEELQEDGTKRIVLLMSMSVPYTTNEQDSNGFIIRLHYDELLATMEDVTISQEDSAAWLTAGNKGKPHASKLRRRGRR